MLKIILLINNKKMEPLLNEISNSIPSQNETFQSFKYSNNNTKITQSCTCNVWKCIKCKGNRPKPSTEKLEEIKKLNKIKKKIIPLKHCGFDCNYCKKTIPYANKYIMDLNIEIKEQKIEKQIQLNRINKNIGQKLENNNDKKIGQILENNYQNDNKKFKEQNQNQNIKSINRYDFKIKKVKGNENCLLRA